MGYVDDKGRELDSTLPQEVWLLVALPFIIAAVLFYMLITDVK